MDKASFSGQFKIGTRIYSGYGLVLGFLCVVVILGYVALEHIGSNVVEFDRVSDNSVRVLTIDRNIVGLRRNVLLFTGGASNQDALGRIHEVEATLKSDISAAINSTRSAERKAMLVEISSLFERYAANVEKVVDLRGRWTKDIDEKMNPLGQGMRNALTGIMAAAFSSEKLDIASRAGMAQESLMLARLSAIKFINKPDAKLADEVHQRAAEFNKRIADLLPHLAEQQQIDTCKKAANDGMQYVGAFENIARDSLEIDRIVNGDNKEIANKISDISKKLTKAQLSKLTDLGEEVKSAVSAQQSVSTIISVVAIIFGILIAFLIARSITKPVNEMTDAMTSLAHGNHSVAVPALSNRDEIGEMAKAVQVFKDNAIENDRLKAAQVAEDQAKHRRQQESEELIDMFSASVSGVFHSLSGASSTMAHTAEGMKSVVSQTNSQIDSVTMEVAEARSNSQAVAAASQELTAAIGEISRLVNTSSHVAEQGSAQANQVIKQVTLLRDASEKIGNIIGIIAEIASQTNLLALNATIEAARAGDAGKGFAVVAGEVKNLSNETQKATIEITSQINEIQSAIGVTVQSVQEIGQTVTHIYESSAEIAAAITEQQSATDEIARNIQFISTSTDKISENMEAVRDSSDKTNIASGQVHDASGSMAAQTEKMSVEVKDFLSAIKGSGTKHQFERLDIDVQASVSIAGRSQNAHARQVSIAGAWLDVRIDQPLGSSVDVTLQGVSRPIKARIAGHSDKGTRLQFPMDAEHLSFMTDSISRLGRKAA